MNKAKILFIVEGEVREKKLFRKITQVMNINAEIFSVCANIHMLYKKLKDYDFNANITQVLLELNGVDSEDKKMLTDNSFAYTYLIFDTDLQHYDLNDNNLVNRGLKEIQEMIMYFNNETDPTIGKMYVNYPMIESYRDCIGFYDPDYINTTISLDNVKDYKCIVGKRGNNTNLSKYTCENFISLAKLNLHKANYIISNKFSSLPYSDYLAVITQDNILKNQNKSALHNNTIFILNTGLFFIIDYWGNNNQFYDKNFID